MQIDKTTIEKLDALQDMGRNFVERNQVHGMAVESQFDTCAFDKWRRKVNDVLFSLGGCEGQYYQRFSKEVVRPHIKDLEEGLRILSAVRDDVSSEVDRHERQSGGSGRPSVSYHQKPPTHAGGRAQRVSYPRCCCRARTGPKYPGSTICYTIASFTGQGLRGWRSRDAGRQPLEVRSMANELESIREIEVLERKGKELCPQNSTISPEQYPIDAEAFHRWRVEVSKMLFSTLGSSNHYYQCFWKTVSKPTVADVEEGLRLLAEVRNDLEGIFPMNALYCPVSQPHACVIGIVAILLEIRVPPGSMSHTFPGLSSGRAVHSRHMLVIPANAGIQECIKEAPVPHGPGRRRKWSL